MKSLFQFQLFIFDVNVNNSDTHKYDYVGK